MVLLSSTYEAKICLSKRITSQSGIHSFLAALDVLRDDLFAMIIARNRSKGDLTDWKYSVEQVGTSAVTEQGRKVYGNF